MGSVQSLKRFGRVSILSHQGVGRGLQGSLSALKDELWEAPAFGVHPHHLQHGAVSAVITWVNLSQVSLRLILLQSELGHLFGFLFVSVCEVLWLRNSADAS